MSTSAVNASSSPYSFLVTSISGWPSGCTSDSATACPYRAGSASVTTWSSIASRPKRASSNFAGALPGRKPGKRTCLANSL